MAYNYALCKHSFGLFFFWHKCSTVVAVGVQTSFLRPPAPLGRGVQQKACHRQVNVTEKNNSRVDVRKPE